MTLALRAGGAESDGVESGGAVVATRTRWTTGYVQRIAWSDVAVVIVAVLVAQLVRFGSDGTLAVGFASRLSYTAVSGFLAFGWIAALALFRARDSRVIGSGAEEYRRVAHASFALFGCVAIVAFLAKLDVARGYLAVALPLGVLLLLFERWQWRRWLVRRRSTGAFTSSVVVIGSPRAAEAMAATFESDPAATYRVVGVCVPGAGARPGGWVTIDGNTVPVMGDENSVLDALLATGADTVAITDTESLGTDGMRSLAWELEAVDVDMVVSPGVVDVAGPRLKIRPVAGLPLLHVEEPQYEGTSRVSKVVLDLAGAAALLLLTLPLMLVVALAVKLTTRGPVFYRAERVGQGGETFSMLKFRSMGQDAEGHRDALTARNEGAGPLFKMRRDPRITRVGRVIRRFSVDELPQLLNVLRGEMSIVGPRPPLPGEVAAYTGEVRRRMLVKPGVTGMWQVSGRSDLSWEESVRLDLSYVENWSLVGDLVIAWRTFRAVVRGDGAY